MKVKTDRRGFLKGVAAASLAGALPIAANAAAAKRRSIRFAHMTDFHVMPEKRAGIGMMNSLAHMHRQKDKAEMIVTGGDLVMDAFGATRDRTKTQWEIFTKVLGDHTNLRVEHTLGNHDIWGWSKSGSGATGREPDYGKKWAMELLGLSAPYRSFNHAGWHWIILDSVFPKGEGYTAKLDDAQFEWLTSDLASVPASTPVIVVSHIPILAACAFYDGDLANSGDWKVPGAWMHLDSVRIKDLFSRHPNVKVCLSGHIHLVDRVDYNGVTYLCDGAVCGSWWNGKFHECSPGYAMVNLYDDGSLDREYHEWGWTAG
ncbi:MAG: metallophosphoesterase [Fimbriimonadales bacterium]